MCRLPHRPHADEPAVQPEHKDHPGGHTQRVGDAGGACCARRGRSLTPGFPKAVLGGKLFASGIVGGVGQVGRLGKVRNQSPLARYQLQTFCAAIAPQEHPHASREHLGPSPGVVVVAATYVPEAFDVGFFGGDVAVAHARSLSQRLVPYKPLQ